MAHDGAFLLIVYDDGLTRIADAFQDGGQVAGVGGGEVADGFDVAEQGEGEKPEITASGFSLGMIRTSAWESVSAGRVAGCWVASTKLRP